jgi:hypothetical protein
MIFQGTFKAIISWSTSMVLRMAELERKRHWRCLFFATFNVYNILKTRKVAATAAINGTFYFDTWVTLLLVFCFCFFHRHFLDLRYVPYLCCYLWPFALSVRVVITHQIRHCCLPRISVLQVAVGGWLCADFPHNSIQRHLF